MQNKYLKFLIIALAVVIIVPQIAMAAWWNPFSWGWLNRIFHFKQTEQKQEQQNKPPVACTQDAKQCPDGSYVGRQGPKCGFKPCPEVKVKDETASWKTYKNDKFGFELQYPTNWQLWEANPFLGLIIIYPNNKSEQVINKTILTTDEIIIKPIDSLNGFKTQQVSINGTTWLNIIYSNKIMDGGTEQGLGYAISKNNTYIDIETGISNKETLLKILSTFKFTTPTNSTADWKTYKNDQYGFEIHYPSTFSDYNPLPNFPVNPDILVQLKNNVGSYFVINSLDETGYYAKENLQDIIGLKTQYKPYEKIKIGNLDAFRFYIEQFGSGKNIETFIYDYPQKGKMLRILFEIQDKFFDSESKVFENIVKTFKFTNLTSTAPCKVYTYQDKFFNAGATRACLNNIKITPVYFLAKDQESAMTPYWSDSINDIFVKIKAFYEFQFNNKMQITVESPKIIYGIKNIVDYKDPRNQIPAEIISRLNISPHAEYFSNLVIFYHSINLTGGYDGSTTWNTKEYNNNNGSITINPGYWLEQDNLCTLTTKIGTACSGYVGVAHEFGHAIQMAHPWQMDINKNSNGEIIDKGFHFAEDGNIMSYGQQLLFSGDVNNPLGGYYIMDEEKKKMIVQ